MQIGFSSCLRRPSLRHRQPLFNLEKNEEKKEKKDDAYWLWKKERRFREKKEKKIKRRWDWELM